MKQKVLAIIALLIAALTLFTACGSTGHEELNQLNEQLTLLQQRVDVLEAETAALRAQLEHTSAPETVTPPVEEESDPEAALILYDWLYGDGTLTIDGAFARVMNLGPDAEVLQCSLVLIRNGSEAEFSLLSLLPGEASDSMELELEPFSYDLTAMEEGDALELRLEVLLSDGRQLTAWGGNWEFWDGQLMMIAG